MQKEEQPVLTGTANAGGTEVTVQPGVWNNIVGTFQFFTEYGGRPEHSYFNVRSGLDRQHRPPHWMENKDVAIDGTPLSSDVRREDANFWETRYRRELMIGEERARQKQTKLYESINDIVGSFYNGLRGAGIIKPLKPPMETTLQEIDERIQQENDALALKKRQGSVADAWDALLAAVEMNRPLAKIAAEYRPRVDFYGIDPFLDSAPSLMWLCTKVGIGIGLALGTAKTLSVINADAQYLRASGIGILSVLNITVFAQTVKWGGNMFAFSAAFCVGDRLAKYVKWYVYPEHEASHRSMLNYSMGLSMSFGLLGLLPWWILNDVRFAVRLSATGLFMGGVLGCVVGTAIDRLVSLNLSRLQATPREVRRYEALLKRQEMWVQKERTRERKESGNSLLF